MSRVLKLHREGALVPAEESCLLSATDTWRRRAASDTNPLIVQMIVGGRKIPHYYYRSDEWVEQPFFHSKWPSVRPYVGPAGKAPAGKAPAELYGEGTYAANERIIVEGKTF